MSRRPDEGYYLFVAQATLLHHGVEVSLDGGVMTVEFSWKPRW